MQDRRRNTEFTLIPATESEDAIERSERERKETERKTERNRVAGVDRNCEKGADEKEREKERERGKRGDMAVSRRTMLFF